MTAIDAHADRTALLRYLALSGDVADLVNRYHDLGVNVVAHALIAKAHEAMAITFLPPAPYRAPSETQSAPDPQPKSHKPAP